MISFLRREARANRARSPAAVTRICGQEMPLGSGVKNYEACYLGKAFPTQKKTAVGSLKKTSPREAGRPCRKQKILGGEKQ